MANNFLVAVEVAIEDECKADNEADSETATTVKMNPTRCLLLRRCADSFKLHSLLSVFI